ncbi:MAG: PhnD/SsuA/transferrin family substrate-binding protein [Rhodobacteraceae bacterium]|nr:PhnD/SsuA/transferrin family substrate-binding protein [Paracoccaceae bacterium]
MWRIWQILAIIWLASSAVAQDRVAHIGVLAFRGAETTVDAWQPLANYLSADVDGWRFEIVPVTLVSAPEALESGRLQFFVTNPGHYVSLAPEFGLSPLATREKSGGLMHFGVAVIARNSAGISTLGDLHGKTVAAVSPEAFGGFQLGWQAFMAQGIDPFTDLKKIKFMGFPHDEIIESVRRGDVDAGIIRGGLLEALAAEGRFSMDEFVVLRSNSQMDFPYRVSGELMPEWPFTVVPGVDKSLRESVALSLLQTQNGESGLQDTWSAPLSYERVRLLIAAFEAREVSAILWPYFLAGGVVLLLIGFVWRRKPKLATAETPETPDPEAAATTALFDRLTKREREVLALICAGKASKEIAEKLGVSLKTIEYHRANLLQKTKAGTSAHLVQLATRFGYDLGKTLGK